MKQLKSALGNILKECYETYKVSEKSKKEFPKEDEPSEKINYGVEFTENDILISIHPGNPHSGPKFYRLIGEIDKKIEQFLSNEGYELEERKFVYDHYVMSFNKT